MEIEEATKNLFFEVKVEQGVIIEIFLGYDIVASGFGEGDTLVTLTVSGLSPEVEYSFSIRVTDLAGNEAAG